MKNVKIEVIGSGCPTCKNLYEKVSEIAKDINSELEVIYTTDSMSRIAELGVMSSPVFAINDKVISAGQILSEDEIKDAILQSLNS